MQNCTVPRFFNLPANGREEPAPQDLQDRLALAFADHQVRALAQKTAFRLVELARKAALDQVMQNAIDAADPADGNAGVIEALEHAFADISTQLAAWNEAAKLAEARGKARAAEIAPLIRRAGNATIRIENEILQLKMLLNDARRNGLQPSEKLKKYQAAGLSAKQIAVLGDGGPTAHDVENAEWELKVHEGELQRITSFLSDPLHRVSLLQGIELTPADDSNPGRFTPPPVYQQGEVK